MPWECVSTLINPVPLYAGIPFDVTNDVLIDRDPFSLLLSKVVIATMTWDCSETSVSRSPPSSSPVSTPERLSVVTFSGRWAISPSVFFLEGFLGISFIKTFACETLRVILLLPIVLTAGDSVSVSPASRKISIYWSGTRNAVPLLCTKNAKRIKVVCRIRENNMLCLNSIFT